MGKPFFDNVLNLIGLQRKSAIGPFPADKTVYKSIRELMNEQGSVLTQPYKQNVWIYAAINAIASNISRVPFVIRKDIGSGLSKKIEEGAIYDLFLNPNPLMSQKQLIEATMIFLGLKGEAMWVFEGRDNITQLPKEIWTFSPSRFTPIQHEKTGMVLGWQYENGSNIVTLLNHEVLFFKYFNPYDDIRGLSPLSAAEESINQDYYAGKYNTAFFKNGASVDGFISVEGELTDEQFNRTLKQFEDRHKGAEKAHKIALLEGGGKFTQASITKKDMEFVLGKQQTKHEILAAFKVNEVILGDFSMVKSYDGIKAADKAFWEECLLPKTHYLEDHLWAKFFSHLGQRRGKGKIWGEFDLATVGSLQVNFDDKITTASKMFTMGWPINAINRRLELGMEDVKWGDEWWVPGGYLPATILLNGKPEEEKPNPDDDSNEDPDEGKLISSPHELEFRNKIKKFIFEVRKKVLSSIYNDEFIRPNIKKEFDKLKQDLLRSYQGSICSVFAELSFQAQFKEKKVDVNSMEVISYISTRTDVLMEGFAGLIEDLFEVLEKSKGSKDEQAEKVRIVFNALTQKALVLTKAEIDRTIKFGKDFFIKKEFGQSLLLGGK